MGKRGDALWRIAALIDQAVLGYILAFIVGIVGLVWMVVDILWQLIAGSDGLSSSSTPAMWVDRFFSWSYEQTVFAITGKGSFQLLP